MKTKMKCSQYLSCNINKHCRPHGSVTLSKKNYHPVVESEKVTLENQHTKLKAAMDLTN